MNSVSAFMGRFNELSNQMFDQSQQQDQGKHLGVQRGHGHNHGQGHGSRAQDSGQSVSTSLYEVSLSFSSSSVSTHEKGVRVLEQELEVRFTGAKFSQTPAPFIPAFEPPSSDEVANNVLGFIENRIKQEADGGASPERLENLLSQARAGVEKGFGQALEQIDKMGLMTEELGEEIDESFTKVNAGLDELVNKYVTDGASGGVDSDDMADEVVIAAANAADVAPVEAQKSENIAQPQANVQSEKPVKSVSDGQGDAVQNSNAIQNSNINAGYSSYSALSERAAIQITTQDGDVVSFNLEQIQASFEQGQLSGDRFGFESTQMAGQYSSGQYNYSIDGELDEGEIEALNGLMMQIEGMSDQFFSGDFQGAFQSAMELGFDSQEIAGFSVNLSQTQVQQVSAYQQVADMNDAGEASNSGLPSLGASFDPLSQFFDSLQAAFDKASAFAQPQELISTLFDRVVSDRLEGEAQEVVGATPFESMNEYVQALLARS